MKHQFSIFFKELNQKHYNLELADKDLINRISKVLRLNTGEDLILFNNNFFAEYKIKDITKSAIFLETSKVEIVKAPKIKFILYVGLLKKEALEEVLYAATELGVSEIQPIISEKIHKNWFSKDYLDRLNKIIIAAAEQSKNYNIPILNESIKFDEFISLTKNKTSIFFDLDGQNILPVYDKVKNQKEINLIIGPEGDFSVSEKEIIKNSGFLICRLTPTVLRSVQAVNVAAGAIRSLFNN